MVSTHFGLVLDLFWATRNPKRTHVGPKRPIWRSQRSSEGPRGPHLDPIATDWSDWAGIMVTTHFGLVWGLFWATRDPKRAFLASKRPQNDVFGRFLQLDGSK